MLDIVFLRHGRSLADDEKKCEGRYDSPLTKIGEEQAHRIATYFRENNYDFSVIITSPLKRARKTAEIINEYYNIRVEEDDLLLEIDNGVIAGMQKDKLEEIFPSNEFYSPFKYFPQNSGENTVLVHSRAGMAVNSIIKRGIGRYLVVSHGGILNAIMRNILGINYMVNNSGVVFNFADTGFIHIAYEETKNKWILLKMI